MTSYAPGAPQSPADDAAAPHSCCGGSCGSQAERPAEPGSTRRRTVLRGGAIAAAAGAGAVALSGCTEQIRQRQAAQSHQEGSEATDVLAADELPVGHSKAVAAGGRTVLLHRVDETTVSAFSNICTHQGCLVQPEQRSSGPVFMCPCHGAAFDVTTGAVLAGPAEKPLPDFTAEIADGRILVRV
ncbi:Rieske (2Fe-2S) protein [Micrococcus sp.]|uniref:Rieske (2Fe-2S) protein n=1 Tax=Micrococcus sp. TaxID=1271 RepID=UPI002A90C56F|nr:Rieske (2Fe-2S) protein [Micrococcus sp.]MDY6055500.1 Rieske (2Fe-2S) protein [Micrococcus sp.]